MSGYVWVRISPTGPADSAGEMSQLYSKGYRVVAGMVCWFQDGDLQYKAVLMEMHPELIR